MGSARGRRVLVGSRTRHPCTAMLLAQRNVWSRMPASFTRTVNCEVDMQFLMRGNFYEFEFGRVVSRPGQPLAIRQDIEIGREIPRELAFTRVRNGGNVYTVGKEDAC